MKIFITVVGAGLLALSCVTASDARSHAKRHSPTQSQADYYRSDYDTVRDRGFPPLMPAFVMNAAPTAAVELRMQPRL